MAENTNADVKKLTFEKALAELEQIVQKLEGGAVALEESVTIYERGEAAVLRARRVVVDVFVGMEQRHDVEFGNEPRIAEIDIAEVGEIAFRDVMVLGDQLDVGLVFDDRRRNAEYRVVQAVFCLCDS